MWQESSIDGLSWTKKRSDSDRLGGRGAPIVEVTWHTVLLRVSASRQSYTSIFNAHTLDVVGMYSIVLTGNLILESHP